ncbi:MAG: substrate-binding periplasmic protein [Spirochaetia bacterium]
MKKVILVLCFLGILAGFVFAQSEVPVYQIMTENYPPFNYEEDGEITGFSTELVREMMERLGHPDNIRVLPWSRAYNITQSRERNALFSMARTEPRENNFQWVGPLIDYEVVFFKRAGSDLEISSLEDARDVRSIGTGLNTSTGEVLLERGFTNLDQVANSSLNARKLVDGRIDLWLSGRLSGIYRARQSGIDPSLMEVAYVMRREPLYFAFSRSTPEDVIQEWQNVLEEVREDGTYEEILNRYIQ